MNESKLQAPDYRMEETWVYLVTPPVHVRDPYASTGKTSVWRNIEQVKVTRVDGVRWEAEAKGRSATKTGALRGTYTERVYGPEADALCAEALAAAKESVLA